MPRYRFRTICPICLNDKKFNWCHGTDEGNLYIWHNCKLQCNECSKMSFILNWKFNCLTINHHTYEQSNGIQLIAAISEIASIEGIDGSVKKEMLEIIYSKSL